MNPSEAKRIALGILTFRTTVSSAILGKGGEPENKRIGESA